MHRVRSLLSITLVVAACAAPAPSVPPPSGPVAVETPSVAPSITFATLPPLPATARPAHEPEWGSLPKSATAESRGIRLTLSLEMNPLDAGHGAEATVTLENRSRGTLEWEVDGCDINAWIVARSRTSWRDSAIDLPAQFDERRDELRTQIDVDQPIRLGFLRPLFIVNRNIGCADTAFPRELRPGRTAVQSFTWDGSALGRLGPAPGGPVTITSRFERWRLGGRTRRSLAVDLDAWVLNGRREDFLSPLEAIDIAFGDQRFVAMISGDVVPSNANPLVEFDRDLGIWLVGWVGFREEDSTRVLHAAYIDPYSREVFEVRSSRVD